jgi:hypothetical protein
MFLLPSGVHSSHVLTTPDMTQPMLSEQTSLPQISRSNHLSFEPITLNFYTTSQFVVMPNRKPRHETVIRHSHNHLFTFRQITTKQTPIPFLPAFDFVTTMSPPLFRETFKQLQKLLFW